RSGPPAPIPWFRGLARCWPAATPKRYLAAPDPPHLHADRGARLSASRQATGVVAVTPVSRPFSGRRMAASDRRHRARRDRGRRGGARGARGDGPAAAALVGARAPRHLL